MYIHVHVPVLLSCAGQHHAVMVGRHVPSQPTIWKETAVFSCRTCKHMAMNMPHACTSNTHTHTAHICVRLYINVYCLSQGGTNYWTKDNPIVVRGRKNVNTSGPATLRDEVQTLYTCRFSPNVTNAVAWLAYGGMAGFVRCQRLTVRERF